MNDLAFPVWSFLAESPTISRYEIEGPLGEGGMAVVYRAWDSELRRPVALKILKDDRSAHEEVRCRFRREAQAAATLSHRNVVAVHDAGEEAGRMYLVLELVEGSSLAALMVEHRRDLPQMLAWLEQAARGVGEAHARGIVHRDVKPANILVPPTGQAKVGDFGLAHRMESPTALTRTGMAMGTPAYMAPEQVRGCTGAIGPHTDVYALGAILYEMLTDHPPHAGPTIAEILSKTLNEDPAPPRKANPAVSRDLENVCLKALEKDPSRRYRTATEFAEELKRCRIGEPALARPPGRFRRGLRWLNRHRFGTALLLAPILASAMVCALWTYRTERLKRRIETLVQRAGESERAGRFGEARDLYSQVRALAADHPAVGEGYARAEAAERRRISAGPR